MEASSGSSPPEAASPKNNHAQAAFGFFYLYLPSCLPTTNREDSRRHWERCAGRPRFTVPVGRGKREEGSPSKVATETFLTLFRSGNILFSP